ncbi:MAG: hypothetical protein L3J39_01655 [Verrucomicrobiales bacterium]|nr:hypothetical protein [Verrucomicrobiales bacterium]
MKLMTSDLSLTSPQSSKRSPLSPHLRRESVAAVVEQLLRAGLLALIFSTIILQTSARADVQVDSDSTVQFLLAHQKSNAAFGPIDQEHSDLAWNYPAVHALRLLRVDIPRAEDCLENGLWAAFRSKDAHATSLYWDFYQKVRLNLLLREDPTKAHRFIVSTQKKGAEGIAINKPWKLTYMDRKIQYYPPYGLGKFHDISSLWYMAGSLIDLGAEIENAELARDFIYSRQTPSGGFENVYESTQLEDASAHIIVTYQAVLTLKALELTVPKADACAAWIQSCQTSSGGFRWNPSSSSPSNKPDVWYTWAAIRALDKLGRKPKNTQACIDWLNSLQNADGGFGDRPEWRSRLYSTYYAVHALAVLTGDAKKGIHKKKLAKKKMIPIEEGKYSIFQAQFKTPSTEDGEDKQIAMVEEISKLGFDFVGVKTADVSAARAYVKEKGYSLEIVACPENYAHHLLRRGGHPANHVSNWIIPPAMTTAQARKFNAADEAGKKGLSWPEFSSQAIEPLRELGSLIYPEMEYSMISAYEVYDDGLEGPGGYNAVIAALGWAPWDWVRHFPYRDRWVGRLPMLSDCDSHGDVSKWILRLNKQRTLYIAESHLLGGLLDACRNRRSVCVIRDESVSGGIVYYGAPAAVAYVKKHRDQWIWW